LWVSSSFFSASKNTTSQALTSTTKTNFYHVLPSITLYLLMGTLVSVTIVSPIFLFLRSLCIAWGVAVEALLELAPSPLKLISQATLLENLTTRFLRTTLYSPQQRFSCELATDHFSSCYRLLVLWGMLLLWLVFLLEGKLF